MMGRESQRMFGVSCIDSTGWISVAFWPLPSGSARSTSAPENQVVVFCTLSSHRYPSGLLIISAICSGV